MFDIPLTNSMVLQLRSLMVKTTSPASVTNTSWMFMAYLRPWLANWIRPLLMISWPFSVHEGSSMMSCDRVHSKLQNSPSRTEIVRKRLTMVMFRSTKESPIELLKLFCLSVDGSKNTIRVQIGLTTNDDLGFCLASPNITRIFPSIIFSEFVND